MTQNNSFDQSLEPQKKRTKMIHKLFFKTAYGILRY